MGVLDAALHAINFILPAVFVAIFVSWLGGYFKQNRPLARFFATYVAINFIVCLGVLIAGLLLTGRDGKMLTYLCMVLASATVQWIVSGAWRK